MITINNNITEESCLLYGPEGNQDSSVLIGEIKNDLAFLDVRVQIAEKKLAGYFIVFQGERYYIDEDGRLPDYPNDLFPSFLSLISKLV
jgi:hypothetical protein